MKRFTVILTILFAILSIVNLVVVTTWLSYLTPFIFLIDLLLSVYWIIKVSPITVISLIATLTQIFPITSVFRSGLVDEQYQMPGAVKVASYNIQNFIHDNTGTSQHIVSILEKEGVDIVCFQEFSEDCDSAVFYRRFMNYPYQSIQDCGKPNETRLAIFSKHPIAGENKLIFKNNINSAMSADIVIGDELVRIINCHFQTTGISYNRKYGGNVAIIGASDNSVIRNEQVKAVANVVKSTLTPVILCGDFNDPPISYSYRTFNRLLDDGFKYGGKGYASTFVGGFKKLLRIDYIFNSDEMECTMYESPEYIFSDHKPVISTLEYKKRK